MLPRGAAGQRCCCMPRPAPSALGGRHSSRAQLNAPISTGFTGYYGDPTTPRRTRVNAGAPFTPSLAYPRFVGVNPRRSCPRMTEMKEDAVYYCRGQEFGYCDRRSGTCFCNNGYGGEGCDKCSATHYEHIVNGEPMCFPRSKCPNDCSGGGSCEQINELTRTKAYCKCERHRVGVDCGTSFSEYLDRRCYESTRTDDNEYIIESSIDESTGLETFNVIPPEPQGTCERCVEGFYLFVHTNDENDLDLRQRISEKSNGVISVNGPFCEDGKPRCCRPCSDHDPRCASCDQNGCRTCADPVLTSVQRSGRRKVDADLCVFEPPRLLFDPWAATATPLLN